MWTCDLCRPDVRCSRSIARRTRETPNRSDREARVRGACLTRYKPANTHRFPRERGGIGRRTRFRFWRGNSREGSTPSVRTEIIFESDNLAARPPIWPKRWPNPRLDSASRVEVFSVSPTRSAGSSGNGPRIARRSKLPGSSSLLPLARVPRLPLRSIPSTPRTITPRSSQTPAEFASKLQPSTRHATRLSGSGAS